MTAILIPVISLLLSFAILLMGNGLQGTLLPLRAGHEGFSPLSIGIMGATYYAGYIGACFAAPHVVARVGHIRSFTVFGTVASAAAMVHAIFVNDATWWTLRLITGFCMAGLYMIMESWINERAGTEHRGQILSVYQIVNLVSLTVGQMLLTVSDPRGFELFALSSILVSVALVPVALTRTTAPKPLNHVRIRLRWVWGISPVGIVGCVTVGLVNGAVWTVVPLFAQRLLPNITELAVFMSLIIIGGAVFQWPLGRWSDRTDRRWVIIAICLGGGLAGIAIVLFGHLSNLILFALAFVYGGFTFSLYAVVLAHANDAAGPQDFVEIASTLLLVFAVAAVAGPLLASGAMQVFGYNSFFGYSTLVHILTAAFAFYRMNKRAAPPPEAKSDFVHMPRTSPEVFSLDPRSDADGNGSGPALMPDDTQ
ncbi:MAG: MFS transporter [Rhodospirillaceae bacterium]